VDAKVDSESGPRGKILFLQRLRIPVGILSSCAAILILALGFILETGRARLLLVPMLAAAALPSPLLALACRTEGRRRAVAVSIFLGALGIVSLVAAFLAAPSGRGEAGAPVQQAILTDQSFPRFSLFNLLPDVDQTKLGIVFGPLVGVLQGRDEARRIAETILPLERAAEDRPEYKQMGSISGWTLAENWEGTFDVGHLYQQVPVHASGERLPVLIVLHGFGGNHKSYPLAFEEFGAKNRFLVLCPSYGMGFYGDGCLEAIERVRAYAVGTLGADPERIYLLGYSNGGIGVFKAAAAHPDQYAGMILVSAAFRPEFFTPEARAAWGERPVLSFSGGKDRRMPLEYILDNEGALRHLGFRVTSHSYPQEDHFLIFSRRQDIADRIAAWILRHP
jgi:predicted esterase